jgi:Membrane-associating domain
MIVVAYHLLAPRFLTAIAHPIIKLVIDAVTMLFWFAGFIALAVLASAFGAYNWYGVDYNSTGWDHFYKITAAMAAFGALEWWVPRFLGPKNRWLTNTSRLLFIATTVFSALELFRGKSTKETHVAANPEVQV